MRPPWIRHWSCKRINLAHSILMWDVFNICNNRSIILIIYCLAGGGDAGGGGGAPAYGGGG